MGPAFWAGLFYCHRFGVIRKVRFKFLGFCFLLVLFLGSCKKESNIGQELEPGERAGQVVYRLLSLNAIAESFIYYQAENFLTTQTQRIWKDSLYTDGNPLEMTLDFGAGVVCADGINRRGRLHVFFKDNMGYGKGLVKLLAEKKDSFEMFSLGKWTQYVMEFNLTKHLSDTALLWMDVETEGYKLNIDSGNCVANYAQPILQSRSSVVWNGTGVLGFNNSVYHFLMTGMKNEYYCRSRWNLGKMELAAVSNGKWELNFDPFGNAACDDDYKVSKGSGLTKNEMIFKAW